MSRHVYEGPAPAGPQQGEETVSTPSAAAKAHDDLALDLPSWDLLPAAEFVRRRPAGG
jgi:hypothetical protein